ncbi:MAG TPA: ferrous iron transporter B, partial [Firmicutes bacterium]|nr:ferrous iron transporter B [Bacillota bacterium]
MKVALTGNPNSGKTTLFNAITGRVERVGNWPGVTIEKKEGVVKQRLHQEKNEIIVVDLPGAYSMSPFTSEESITSDFVKNEKPDVIINIVDAANLRRSLFFTTQLLELGIPVVVALNKSDLLKKKGIVLNVELLAKRLGCPVVKTIATGGSNSGLKELMAAVVGAKGRQQTAPFNGAGMQLTDQEAERAVDKKRFAFVDKIVDEVEEKKISSNGQTKQDAVDKILAHPWLGLPIFALVMWTVFS